MEGGGGKGKGWEERREEQWEQFLMNSMATTCSLRKHENGKRDPTDHTCSC